MIIEFSYVVYYLLGKHSGAAKTKIIVTHPEKKRSCNATCLYVFLLCGLLTNEIFSIEERVEMKVAFCYSLYPTVTLQQETSTCHHWGGGLCQVLFDSEVHIYPAWTWLDSSQLRQMPCSPQSYAVIFYYYFFLISKCTKCKRSVLQTELCSCSGNMIARENPY